MPGVKYHVDDSETLKDVTIGRGEKGVNRFAKKDLRVALMANGEHEAETRRLGGKHGVDPSMVKRQRRMAKSMGQERLNELACLTDGRGLAEIWQRHQLAALEEADKKRSEAPFRDLIIAAGIAYDKFALLSGGPTARVDVNVAISHEDNVDSIIKALEEAKAANARLLEAGEVVEGSIHEEE